MRILVLSEHDDCVGPMAAAFLGDFSSRMEVVSAGRAPAERICPLMALAMKECLIDLSGYQPRPISESDLKSFDIVYEIEEREIPDSLDGFRVLRDKVKNETFIYFRDHLKSYL